MTEYQHGRRVGHPNKGFHISDLRFEKEEEMEYLDFEDAEINYLRAARTKEKQWIMNNE
jgi:hypothetical protein